MLEMWSSMTPRSSLSSCSARRSGCAFLSNLAPLSGHVLRLSREILSDLTLLSGRVLSSGRAFRLSLLCRFR